MESWDRDLLVASVWRYHDDGWGTEWCNDRQFRYECGYHGSNNSYHCWYHWEGTLSQSVEQTYKHLSYWVSRIHRTFNMFEESKI